MEIEQATKFLSARLTEIAREEFRTHSHSCPHCGNSVLYPTIARAADIEDFRRIMTTALKVMDGYGITGNLLAEITARCHIEIARRKSKAESHKGG